MNRTTSRAGVLALAALLAACAGTPAYEAPRIATVPAYHAAAAAAPGEAPPLDRWWLGFQDPELARLIERALAQNLDLEAAAARVEQARASAGIAAAALLPSLSAQAGISAERQSLESPLGKLASSFPGYDRTPVLRSEALVASWELDPAGGLKRQREQRGFEAQAVEAERLGVRVSVAAEVAGAQPGARGLDGRRGEPARRTGTGPAIPGRAGPPQPGRDGERARHGGGLPRAGRGLVTVRAGLRARRVRAPPSPPGSRRRHAPGSTPPGPHASRARRRR